MKYKMLEHTADIKLHAEGKTQEELFVNAALGMMEFLYGKKVFKCKTDLIEDVEVDSSDLQSLLVDWLSEILYLSDTNDSAYTDFKIEEISEYHIKAEIGGCKAEAEDDIKAVTYNELVAEEKDGGWVAEVVFDI